MSNLDKGTLIVVAEDDADDRLLIEDALKEAHLSDRVVFVEDGVALMDYLHRRGRYEALPRKEKPELILLDLNMPRKNGWQVLKEMKTDENFNCIPVVVLTTSNSSDDVRRSYQMGGNGFITKPNSFKELVDMVRALEKYWFETVKLP